MSGVLMFRCDLAAAIFGPSYGAGVPGTIMRAHRYVRAYLAGIALPTIVVCAAGFPILGLFDRFDLSVQRALILPLATNPFIWGVWNIAWVALGC